MPGSRSAPIAHTSCGWLAGRAFEVPGRGRGLGRHVSTLDGDGKSRADPGRRRHDRWRRARRRPVDDADEDARRRGDDGPDCRSCLGRLRGRALRGAEDRGRRRARPDRAALADPGDRRHPLQRVARAPRDRRRRRRGADQPRQHRRPRQGRARRQGGQEGGRRDADRRQLRLAAGPSAGARPAGSGRGARRRRRSRRSRSSSGSTSATSRSPSRRRTCRR